LAKRKRKGTGTYRTRSGATVVVFEAADGSLRPVLSGWEDPDPRVQEQKDQTWLAEWERFAEALAPGNKNAHSARSPRKAVTKADWKAFRAQFVARYGKSQGWQKAAAMELGVTTRTIRDRMKEK
jgi:hypothetical protein